MSSDEKTFEGTAHTLAPEGEVSRRPPELPERYEDRGLIGSGNMGEVRRVYDRLLRREVAMKIISWTLTDTPAARERFVSEANLSARLQHPGIVPVHDRGVSDRGRAWFTMPLVRGHTFSALISDLHAARRPGRFEPTATGWTFRRLITVYGAACDAVAYAHSHRVIHRDLKPGNIMVGAFGQVQVMDWGISGLYDGVEEGLPGIQSGVSGTPAFMAPEQADGSPDAQGPWTDVYALGAILFVLLTGRSPYTGTPAEILAQLRQTAPAPSIHSVIQADHPPLADGLVRLCAAAMAARPRDRPQQALDLSRQVKAWLDGELRREQARKMVAAARPDQDRAAALRADAEALREASAALLSPLPPNAPISRKAAAWEMEDRAVELERDAGLTEARWEQALRAALEHDPDLPEAHSALASHYQQQMAAAEARRDPVNAARFEVLLRGHDRGEHAEWLSNTGRLTLHTRPEARIEILRYRARRRRLVPEPFQTHRAPLREHTLPVGSYLLRLTAPGCEPVPYPVQIERGAHWDAGDPIELPALGSLGDACIVPGGPCWLGGDPDALDVLPRRRWWIDGFLIQRTPVTYRQYLVFLNDLRASGRLEEALERLPAEPGSVSAEPHPHVVLKDGTFVLGRDGQDHEINPDWPVVYVRHEDAAAYAFWWSMKTGRMWRLPHDHEWEKAARGVDGRFFPWGDHFDANWACTMHSRTGETRPATVEEFPEDVSPYGVLGMAGNVRDWCNNGYQRTGPGDGGRLTPAPAAQGEPWRMMRGGAWYGSPSQSRLGSRFVGHPSDRLGLLGVRLVSPLP